MINAQRLCRRSRPVIRGRCSALPGRALALAVVSILLLGACRPAEPPASEAPAPAPATPPAPAAPVWVSIFNGKDLAGWTPKFVGAEAGVNYKDTFRVEDGALVVSYDDYDTFEGRFGHLFLDHEHSHYRLRLEYRFTGEQTPGAPGWAHRNSGVMIHGQAPETMRIDQPFPVSVEVQLLGGDGTNERPTGNVCTPGTHVVMDGELVTRHCTNSMSETYHGDDWVTMEIEVRGGEAIRHLINGQLVFEYGGPRLDENDPDAQAWIERRGGEVLLTGGTISLQAESHPCAFRNIEIMVLEPR